MPARFRSAFCTRCNREVLLIRNPKHRPKYICAVCNDPVMLPNVRGAIPTRSKHTGSMFQSKEESKREPSLLALQRAGEIQDLRCEAWRDLRTERYRLDVFGTEAVLELLVAASELAQAVREDREGVMLAKVRRVENALQDLKRARHHVTTYQPDYEYTTARTNQRVVEDVKAGSGRRGAGDPTFVMKRRLMLACHGIEVLCVYGSGRNVFGRRTG